MYIQNRLEGSYSCFFDVIILKENVTTNFYLYSAGGTSNVAWTFVNTAKPNWSYIINAQCSTFSSNPYVSSYVTGSGIPASKVTVINNILRSIDSQYAACTCADLDKISQLLTDLDGNMWSIVCKVSTGLYVTGRIRNSNAQYF